MMKQFKIPYARHTSDNMPIAALDYNGEVDLTCYECNDTLYYRKGHEKISKKSGLSYQVRAHFYHTRDNHGALKSSSCSGECTEHLLAKEIVAKFTKFRFWHNCKLCFEDYHPLSFTDTRNVKTEYRWHDPVNNTLFIPDVAFLDEHDTLKSAIEIHHTHPIPDEKIRAFNNASISWVEVEARHIIDQFNAKKNNAWVQRSSSFTMSHTQCNVCCTRQIELRLAEQKAYKLKQERDAEAEKLRIEDMKRIALERAEEYKKEQERKEVIAKEEREKKAEEARLEKEQREALALKEREKKAEEARLREEKKKEEAAINEKKRKEFYDNQRAVNTKRAKTDILTSDQKQAFLDEAFRIHVEQEYIERRKHLLAYQDMIVAARKIEY